MAIFFKTMNQVPQNILIARTDRIGDFVLTLPVFEVIKNACNANLSVLCSKPVTPLVQENPYLDETIVIEDFEDQESLIHFLKDRNYDALLVMVNDPTILKLLPHLKFIPNRIGPVSKLQTLLHYTHPVLQKRSKSIQNEAQYNLELLEAIGIKSTPTKPKIFIREEEIQSLIKKLASLRVHETLIHNAIVVHAGMSGSALNWPDNHYKALLTRFADAGLTVFLTGASEDEKAKNKWLLESISEIEHRCMDLTAKLNLRELTVLLSLIRLYIGPSTGPTHIANGVGTPVISFYPPIQVQSATRWQPFLSEGNIYTPQVECGQKYKCLGKKCPFYYCMDLISPEEVYQQTLSILESNKSTR